MSGTAKGLFLGACNAVVIALGFATTLHGHARMEFAAAALGIGLLPALGTGGVVGALAESMTRRRHVVVVGIPLAVVIFLGFVANVTEASDVPTITGPVIALACIPTLAAALILERWTRPATPAAVPPAHAMR